MQTLRNLTNDPAIRRGLIFGCILGLIHVIYNLINNFMNLQGKPYEWLNNLLLISLIIFLTFQAFLCDDIHQVQLLDSQRGWSAPSLV
jgi:hypothetical protein